MDTQTSSTSSSSSSHYQQHRNLILHQSLLIFQSLTVVWTLAIAIVVALIATGLVLLQRHASLRAERAAMETAAANGVDESAIAQAEGRRRRWCVEQVRVLRAAHALPLPSRRQSVERESRK